MTVYQTKSATSQPGSADQRVTLSVKTIRPFIGETWYAPNLIVSHGFNRSIAVKVELLAGDITYLNYASGLTNASDSETWIINGLHGVIGLFVEPHLSRQLKGVRNSSR